MVIPGPIWILMGAVLLFGWHVYGGWDNLALGSFLVGYGIGLSVNR